MKEFIKKLIERLEESVSLTKMERMESRVGKKQTIGFGFGVRNSVEIVNQLAEEYHKDNNWQTTRQYLDEKYFSKIRELSAKYDYPCENIAISFDWVFGLIDKIENQGAEEYNNESVKGDLISRSAVIDELNGIYLDNPWDDKEDILEKAIGIVDHFPTAYNNGWILCSERLPEDGVDVLVWFEYFRYGDYNGLFQTIGISFTYNGDWSGFVNGSSGWSQLRVIAWQPLPPKYEPKGE